MLRHIVGRLITSAALYDFVQSAFGNRSLRRRLADNLSVLDSGPWTVDVGGGTGSAAVDRVRYVCLDLERPKLERFRRFRQSGLAVQADATRCPFRGGTVDAVVCAKVAHHLDDPELASMVSELARILTPSGTLLFADAVRSDRWMSRILWRIDRGAHPRREQAIEEALRAHFLVMKTDRFRLRVFHDFVLYTAVRSAGSATPQVRRLLEDPALPKLTS